MDALSVRGLKKIYRGGRGVSGVSFAIAPGDVFGLLGANGAGKTTVMKAVAQLVRPDSGEIEVFGESPAQNPARALRLMGCLIETPAFYDFMSAERNLKAAARFYGGVTQADILEKLEMVGLSDTKRLKARAFSLGMRQRLGLAIAMLQNPLLYILDEPANGLDIDGIIGVRGIILELARNKDAAFLVSSHMAAEIEKTCNKVGVIHNGAMTETRFVRDVVGEFGSVEDYYVSVIKGEHA
jgi:ABC-2 type transport system ATP-binding protein